MSELVAAMPFAERLGLSVEAASKDEVRGSFGWTEELCTAGSVLHGGALMAAADSLGAICAYLNVPTGASTATIESKTNFFRAVRGGRISLVSTPLHVGRATMSRRKSRTTTGSVSRSSSRPRPWSRRLAQC